MVDREYEIFFFSRHAGVARTREHFSTDKRRNMIFLGGAMLLTSWSFRPLEVHENTEHSMKSGDGLLQ